LCDRVEDRIYSWQMNTREIPLYPPFGKGDTGEFNRIIDRPSLLSAGDNVIFAWIVDFNLQLLFVNIPGTGGTFLLKYRQLH